MKQLVSRVQCIIKQHEGFLEDPAAARSDDLDAQLDKQKQSNGAEDSPKPATSV
eukprot:CAMPEP_0197845254 /NCGR_PEP_ID=MMETSP1438-20131217/2198_1 /TAXON_ID=1461541 /ORGANISM="Pterosperma sp., Strain CCMP1384" /LENGTH=53 /DNA_ID=CAMNT_0043456455 /DNA_START=83 /DNA_END=241 /DNA_ORIENTATION=-